MLHVSFSNSTKLTIFVAPPGGWGCLHSSPSSSLGLGAAGRRDPTPIAFLQLFVFFCLVIKSEDTFSGRRPKDKQKKIYMLFPFHVVIYVVICFEINFHSSALTWMLVLLFGTKKNTLFFVFVFPISLAAVLSAPPCCLAPRLRRRAAGEGCLCSCASYCFARLCPQSYLIRSHKS
jgi:hypothetical protein